MALCFAHYFGMMKLQQGQMPYCCINSMTMQELSMKKMLFVALAALTLLAGCNTVSGVGKDVKAGGQALENVSQ